MAKWLDEQRLGQLESALTDGGVEAFAAKLYEWCRTQVVDKRDFTAAIAMAAGTTPNTRSLIRCVVRAQGIARERSKP